MFSSINKIVYHLQNFFGSKLILKSFLPGIAWFFILLILLCIPGKDIPKSGNWLEQIYFDKWVHMGLFGLLTFLFTSPVFHSDLILKKKWIYTSFIVIIISFWGFVTELIQGNLIAGRSFDPYDWMADTLGALVAARISKYYFLDKHAPDNGSVS